MQKYLPVGTYHLASELLQQVSNVKAQLCCSGRGFCLLEKKSLLSPESFRFSSFFAFSLLFFFATVKAKYVPEQVLLTF